jgi:hypothetical protein
VLEVPLRSVGEGCALLQLTDAEDGAVRPRPIRAKIISIEREIVLGVLINTPDVSAVFCKPTIVVPILSPIIFTLKVIISGRTLLTSAGFSAMIDHFLNPPFFLFGQDLYRIVVSLTRMLDTLRDMVALCLQHKRKIELERGLVIAHDEQVRKSVRMDTKHRPNAACIKLVDILAIPTDNLIVQPGLLNLKAGRVDQHIKLVGFTVKYHSGLIYLVYTSTFSID